MINLRLCRFVLVSCALACSALVPLTWGQQDMGCAIARPVPLLEKAGYRTHSFVPGKDNTAVEKAALPAVVNLEIRHYGCEDVEGHKLIFTVRNPKFAASSVSDWLRFAARELSGLKVTERGRSVQKSLRRFLEKIAGQKAPMGGKIELCYDGSKPGQDGCAFKTGGGYVFEVQPDGKAVKVSLTGYTNV